MEWTEIQEFELLRRSRSGDVREKIWAQPANRLVASKHYKVLRADEELVRCRVEARRLATAMLDEERQMELTVERLVTTNPVLACELREHLARRAAVNDLHRQTLAKIATVPGFEVTLTPGVRLGGRPSAPDSATSAAPGVAQPSDPGVPSPGAHKTDEHDVQEEEDRYALHDFLAAVND